MLRMSVKSMFLGMEGRIQMDPCEVI
jgi:hypothetical protein